jgi:hypothetical protein
MAWFARWFRKPAPAPARAPAPVSAPSPPDDIAAARATSREVVGLVVSSLKDSRGIHLRAD